MIKGMIWNDNIQTICISGKYKRRLQFNKKKKARETTIYSEQWIQAMKKVREKYE